MRALLIPFLALGLLAHPAAAEETPRPSLTVSATGEASRVPDLANVNLQVIRTAKTARAALDANTEAMAAVLAAMKAAGVEEKDLQTSSFSINPEYFYTQNNQSNEPPKPPTITGYTVSNALSVRIRDIARVGTILDEAVTLGVNSGGNIEFGSSKAEEAEDEARANAVRRALAKARTLTEAAGVTLGKVLSIQESQRGGVPKMARMRMAEAAMDAPVPVAAGEQSATVSVTIRFEIIQ